MFHFRCSEASKRPRKEYAPKRVTSFIHSDKSSSNDNFNANDLSSNGLHPAAKTNYSLSSKGEYI